MKNRHRQNQAIANWVVTESIKRGLGHLSIEDERIDGRTITLHGREMVNFGSCSYLGLEMDPRLADGAIDAIRRYGTQYSSSRAYVSNALYPELERLLGELFGARTIVTPSTTMGHLCALPALLDDNDAVILDQQVHASVQLAADVLKARGIHVDITPHNCLKSLTRMLKKLERKHGAIWYMIDSMYSMYGDYAPMKELAAMLDEHPKLHLYVDDAHGMSWCGKHGRGHALTAVPRYDRLVVATSLNKAFGAGGGALIFPNRKMYRTVRNCGLPLIFSGPLQPPVLGACIASARLHLSDEIVDMQIDLHERIEHCNRMLKEHGLAQAMEAHSPIFFVKVGLPTVGGNLMARMMEEGFYMNCGVFPAVAWNDTGMRFTLNRHHTLGDISRMVEALAHHLPLARKEEGSVRGILRNLLSVRKRVTRQAVPA